MSSQQTAQLSAPNHGNNPPSLVSPPAEDPEQQRVQLYGKVHRAKRNTMIFSFLSIGLMIIIYSALIHRPGLYLKQKL